jgi:hypothetical protein
MSNVPSSMTRALKWIPLVTLLLCAGLLGTLEYLPWRETNPLRFHMKRPSSDAVLQKRAPVELRVENASNYPVVYYRSSLQSANKTVAHFCQLRGSSGNGVVIQPGGTYTHHQDISGQAVKVVRDSGTEMRYYWAPEREAWFARTFLPALKGRLPSKWAGSMPEIRARVEQESLQVHPERKHDAS